MIRWKLRMERLIRRRLAVPIALFTGKWKSKEGRH